jgi:hypothetical protein
VNRQKSLLSIAHTQLKWRIFHGRERQVVETTAIAKAITSGVKANHRRNHYIGHDFLADLRHGDVPDAFHERLSCAPRPEDERLAASYDHWESTSSSAVGNASHKAT